MEFSKIANDILRIQLLTAEESEFKYQSVFSLVMNKYIYVLRALDFNFETIDSSQTVLLKVINYRFYNCYDF